MARHVYRATIPRPPPHSATLASGMSSQDTFMVVRPLVLSIITPMLIDISKLLNILPALAMLAYYVLSIRAMGEGVERLLYTAQDFSHYVL